MNRISLARLRLALKFKEAVQASVGGGWFIGKRWAMANLIKVPREGQP